MKNLDEDGYPIPVREGVKEFGPESCLAWALYHKSDVQDALNRLESDEDGWYTERDLMFEISGWHAYYRGVGRAFAHEPYYKVTRNYVLIKQQRGLDI